MSRFITTMDELVQHPPEHLLLLYSGGVDGTYLLQLLRDRGVTVTALGVQIGAQEESTAASHAARFGAEYRSVDATDEFFADFAPAAIHADAYYQGQFPVGSTLTRPLMALAAVRTARQLGCDAIGHTATYMQNSALRLSGSIAALDPGLDVVAPFLGSDVPRQRKHDSLRAAGISFSTGIHSIDASPWARVIEAGSLESPENTLDETVFIWTGGPGTGPVQPTELDLDFREGLPVSLDGTPSDLGALVGALNQLGGAHGIGRFSGLEDTAFGVKNHEIREAPAAAVITTAHRALGNAVLTSREHSVRAGLAREWTDTVVHGGWFGHLGQSLARCLADLDRPLNGTVRLRLHRGTVTVLRLDAPAGLYYTKLGQAFHDHMGDYAYTPWLNLATLANRLRLDGAQR